jgi:hypothetical protein
MAWGSRLDNVWWSMIFILFFISHFFYKSHGQAPWMDGMA